MVATRQIERPDPPQGRRRRGRSVTAPSATSPSWRSSCTPSRSSPTPSSRGRSTAVVPTPERWPPPTIDALLLGVFAVQHSVMARPGVQAALDDAGPRARRALDVRAGRVGRPGAGVLAVAPDPDGGLGRAGSPVASVLLWMLFALGWVWVLAMSFAIDHLDLFGLRQVARHLRGLADRPPSFAVPLPHRLVRHPMMLGFFVAFLATPTMTVGHLLFAALGMRLHPGRRPPRGARPDRGAARVRRLRGRHAQVHPGPGRHRR